MGHESEDEVPVRGGLQRHFSRLERSGNGPGPGSEFRNMITCIIAPFQAGRSFWQYPAAAIRREGVHIIIYFSIVSRHLKRSMTAAPTTSPTAPRSSWRRRFHAARSERTFTSSDSASVLTWRDSWAISSTESWAG